MNKKKAIFWDCVSWQNVDLKFYPRKVQIFPKTLVNNGKLYHEMYQQNWKT